MSEDVLSWAYRYVHKGWAVLPVHGVVDGSCTCGDPHDGSGRLDATSIGKHPVGGLSWSDATTELSTIEAWFMDNPVYNVAVSPGLSDLVVIDIDGPTGEATLAALEAEHGPLPATLTDRSGRADGGRHLWFTAPSGEVLASNKLGPGIDTRAGSGYAITAPSTHKSGNAYAWGNWTTKAAALPRWVQAKLTPKVQNPVDVDGEPLPDPHPAWLVRRLAEVPVDGTRHQRHYALVAKAVEMGFTNGQTVTAASLHRPSVDKFGPRLQAETLRVLAKVAHLRLDVEDVSELDQGEYLGTDVGNAQRLVDTYGTRFRWCADWGTWMAWNGRLWARDSGGAIVEAAKAITVTLLEEAVTVADSDERKKAVRWAMTSASSQRIDAMIKLARSAPGIPVAADDFDADPMILNVGNGRLDLRTGQLMGHDPAKLCTKIAGANYIPNAPAPVWEAFLHQVLPDDEVREFVARAAGYSLTGLVTEQKMLIPTGTGANGKSTLLEALLAVWGHYGRQADPGLLLARSDDHPTGVARLQGARFVISSESDEGAKLAEATVKRLTGGDKMIGRYMRQDFFEFTPSHKLWMQSNHKPKVTGTDHAIWRRLRLVPFDVTVADEDQDRQLPDKLRGEADGIMAWAVAGCLRWQTGGLTEPLAVTLATDAYRASQDTLGEFLAEACTFTDTTAHTSAKDLYSAYTQWCDDAGERPKSQRALGQHLSERGLDRVRLGHHNRWHWIGLALTDTTNEVFS